MAVKLTWRCSVSGGQGHARFQGLKEELIGRWVWTRLQSVEKVAGITVSASNDRKPLEHALATTIGPREWKDLDTAIASAT